MSRVVEGLERRVQAGKTFRLGRKKDGPIRDGERHPSGISAGLPTIDQFPGRAVDQAASSAGSGEISRNSRGGEATRPSSAAVPFFELDTVFTV